MGGKWVYFPREVMWSFFPKEKSLSPYCYLLITMILYGLFNNVTMKILDILAVTIFCTQIVFFPSKCVLSIRLHRLVIFVQKILMGHPLTFYYQFFVVFETLILCHYFGKTNFCLKFVRIFLLFTTGESPVDKIRISFLF